MREFCKRNLSITFKYLALSAVLLVGCADPEKTQQKYYESAKEYFEEGDYKKASVEIRNALQIEGDFAEGRYLHALIYEKEENWQQVYANLNLVVELDPFHVDALVKLSQIQLASEMYDEALENADSILLKEPENADAYSIKASAYFQQGDLDKAIQFAEQALANEAGHVAAISVLSEVYKTEDPDFALKVIGDGLQRATDSAMLKLIEIDVLLSNDRIDDAIASYRELIAAHPENLLFHYRLVRLLQDQGRLEKAEEHLRSVVQAQPENHDLKLWLAEFYIGQRDLVSAESVLREFLEEHPEVLKLEQALGQVQAMQRRYGDAESTFKRIVASQKGNLHALEARNQLVELYLMRGDLELARSELEAILAVERENSRALETKARMALAQGRTKEAIADLRIVTRNQVDAVEARLLLARAHEMEGDWELALDNYRQVLEVAPTEKRALVKAARLELNSNQQDNAESMLKRVLKIDPGNPQATGMLVELYSRQKRWDEGMEYATQMASDEKLRAYGSYIQGRLLSQKGDVLEAEKAYRTSLEYEPSAIESLNFLTLNLARQGRVEDAKQFLESHLEDYPEHQHASERLGELLLATDPPAALSFYQQKLAALGPSLNDSHVNLLAGLGKAWLLNGEPNKALAAWEESVALAPNDAGLNVMLAGQYQQMSRYSEAEHYYEQALRIDSNQVVAANNLINLYLEESFSDENLAKSQELSAVLKGQRHPVFLDTLGLVSYHSGNLTGAISLFKAALASPQPPMETHLHLARAYLRNEQIDEAQRQLELAKPKLEEERLKVMYDELRSQISAQG